MYLRVQNSTVYNPSEFYLVMPHTLSHQACNYQSPVLAYVYQKTTHQIATLHVKTDWFFLFGYIIIMMKGLYIVSP